jgi:four helix bundle protein
MKLRIVDDIVAMVGRVHRLAKIVGRQDRDLAKQMKRSSSSVGLNAGEGLYGRDGNRTVRLESAMCSGRETIVALRIAAAADYLDLPSVASEVRDIDRIVATLYRLAYRR